MTRSTEIYVALLGEGIEVWRPVVAEQVDRDVYRIVEQPYDRETERWEFEPGSEVVCAMRTLDDGPILAAVRPAMT
jgi:hypothetical protein